MLPKLTFCLVCLSPFPILLHFMWRVSGKRDSDWDRVLSSCSWWGLRLVFLWEKIFFSSDLFVVLRELWPLLGPYALLQVLWFWQEEDEVIFLCRDTRRNPPLRTGSWRPQSFVTTSGRLRTLEPTPYNISQTSRKCLTTLSSSLLHTGLVVSCIQLWYILLLLGFLTYIFRSVLEILISTRTHTM